MLSFASMRISEFLLNILQENQSQFWVELRHYQFYYEQALDVEDLEKVCQPE